MTSKLEELDLYLQKMSQHPNVYRYSILGDSRNHPRNNSELYHSQQSEIRPRNATYTHNLHPPSIKKLTKAKTNANFFPTAPQSSKETHQKKATQSILTDNNKENQQRFFNNIYNNKIAKLSTTITQKQKQRYLRKLAQTVQGDRLSAVGFQFDLKCIKEIGEFITTSSIKKINLDRNPLGDEGVIKLSAFLGQIELEELSLMSVGMTNKGAIQLFKNLAKTFTIRKLNISSTQGAIKNKITAQGVEHLNYMLGKQECLIDTLHMDSISLGIEGVRTAFDGCKSPPIQWLTLSKNEIGSKNVQYLTLNIISMPIMRLDLAKNSIMDAGMKCLTEILGTSYGKNSISMTLTHLNLSYNMITSVGFEIFCRGMGVNQTLQILTLDENPLGDGDRFFNIKYYLSKNWGLKRLSLNNISPSQKDIKFLCEGLQLNRSLQELILSKNQIDGDTLSSILSMLCKNKSLRQIVMNNCKISDSYIIKNEYLLQTNVFTAIQDIDLENNYINNKAAEVLKKMVTCNKNILKMNLSKNCAGERVICEIGDILKDNESKRPFEHELNYFQSVSDLYEQKRRALKNELQKMKRTEQNLKGTLLTQQIRSKQFQQERLLKLIDKEHKLIRNLMTISQQKNSDSQIESDEGNYITSINEK